MVVFAVGFWFPLFFFSPGPRKREGGDEGGEEWDEEESCELHFWRLWVMWWEVEFVKFGLKWCF